MQFNSVTNSIYQLSSNDELYSKKKHQGASFESVVAATKSEQTANESSQTLDDVFAMDTNQGHNKINLGEYLTPKSQLDLIDLKDVPLLLPTAHNIDTLSKYSEAKFKDLLGQYNIPSPPDTIEFDGEGKLIMPSDYPHAAELRSALGDNPEIESALRTTAALASHYEGIMEGAAFRDEMSTARSQADQDRIVQKYSYLFNDNRPQAQIVLAFLEDGSMLVGEKDA